MGPDVDGDLASDLHHSVHLVSSEFSLLLLSRIKVVLFFGAMM